MDFNIEESETGIVLPVKVTPKARKNAITGIHQGMLKVSITQAPEKGKANVALVQVLSKLLKVKKSRISILSGETSPFKTILFSGISSSEMKEAVSRHIPEKPHK